MGLLELKTSSKKGQVSPGTPHSFSDENTRHVVLAVSFDMFFIFRFADCYVLFRRKSQMSGIVLI